MEKREVRHGEKFNAKKKKRSFKKLKKEIWFKKSLKKVTKATKDVNLWLKRIYKNNCLLF